MLLKNRYQKALLKYGALVLSLGLLSSSALFAEDLRVRHDHDPWGGCEGVLTVSAAGIVYQSEDKEDHARQWIWLDIQTVDRRSADRFTILTYEDQKWILGRDRPWDFTLLDLGGPGLNEELFALIRRHSPRPLVDRVARSITPDYEVAVKHQHTFGGCEGILRFGKDWIVYETDHQEDARAWRRRHEVANVWSTGRFDLELEVYENEGGDLIRARRFRFQLKRPLDEDYYAQLRRDMLPPR